jgi:hypothetical protein
LLLLRQAERTAGVCWRLAGTMPDQRDQSRIRHAMFEMLMARVSAIASGYEDANDLDRLRHDPLMCDFEPHPAIAGRRPGLLYGLPTSALPGGLKAPVPTRPDGCRLPDESLEDGDATA